MKLACVSNVYRREANAGSRDKFCVKRCQHKFVSVFRSCVLIGSSVIAFGVYVQGPLRASCVKRTRNDNNLLNLAGGPRLLLLLICRFFIAYPKDRGNDVYYCATVSRKFSRLWLKRALTRRKLFREIVQSSNKTDSGNHFRSTFSRELLNWKF